MAEASTQFDELQKKYDELKQKYSIQMIENNEYKQQIDDLSHQNEALMREVATYKMEEEYDYTPAMSMGLSSNRTCSTLNSEIIGLKELNQRLQVALDASNEKYDRMCTAHSHQVHSLERTIRALQDECDSMRLSQIQMQHTMMDNQMMQYSCNASDASSLSVETLAVDYEDRLCELELENKRLQRRLDNACASSSIEYIDGMEFEEIALGDSVMDEFEEDDLDEMEQLFNDCHAGMVEDELKRKGQYGVGKNIYRFLLYNMYR